MLTLPTHPGIFVIVLGNMQDGGLPHAGCRCANCQRAWQDPRHQQYVTCLAVVDTRLPSPLVYLLDATPDIKFQLNMLGDLLGAHATRPGRLRQPDGIFLTHAHIGHIAGLAQLSKEAMFVQQLPLFASPRLRQLIHQTVLWQPLVSQLTLHDLLPHTAVNLAHDATLTPILVPHRDEWNTGTYGFLLRGPQRSLFYLPDIDGWSRWPEARSVLAQVDTAVVEVGLGGLLDATNVLPADVAVLTNVGLDHTEILGDTVEKIAQDKSGIIKTGQQVVSGCTQASVQAIVAEKAAGVGANLWQLGRDFAQPQRSTGDEWRFALPDGSVLNAELGLPGSFQAQNAAVALAAITAVEAKMGLSVAPEARQAGLKAAQLAGRVEQIQSAPTVILDGAHNPDKVRAVAGVMAERRTAGRVITVLAIKEGKAAGEMLPAVVALSDELVVTRFLSKGLWRAMSPEALAAEAQAINPALKMTLEPNPLAALRLALAQATAEDVVWVTGSLYLVGDVRSYWQAPADILWALEANHD
ncbi:MAG: MBL fold metallo-hydrolase [Anaerolineales bacterium]|nr:MBL fold metallo-hydrolase [Anaerolineales bacterium]